MKKAILILLVALVSILSIYADSTVSTLDAGSSFAFGKDISGFTGGIFAESKTIYYLDGGFGIGSALSAEFPLYQYVDGNTRENNNPIAMGFGLFASYKLDLTSILSIAANAGAEFTAGRKKSSFTEIGAYDARIIGDLSMSFSLSQSSSLRIGAKAQLPFWGRVTVKTFSSSTYQDTPISFGNYIITPYIGYSYSY